MAMPYQQIGQKNAVFLAFFDFFGNSARFFGILWLLWVNFLYLNK